MSEEKSKMKLPMQQNRSDAFQTPPEALNPLYPFLKREWAIWECACGKGNLVKALQNRGYQSFGTDKELDFLKREPPEHYDCIITNPPYTIKQEFLQRAYDIKKPFAFLLPLTTFETAKRQKLFKEFGLEVIFFDKRINFETPSGKGSGSWFATAWFTNGLNIGSQLNFVNLETTFKKDTFF